MSMFTSTYPYEHRVYNRYGTQPVGGFDKNIETIAQALSEKGYDTVGHHDGGQLIRKAIEQGWGGDWEKRLARYEKKLYKERGLQD